METVPFSEVLRETCDLAGLTYPPGDREFSTLRTFISRSLGTAWRMEKWEGITLTEPRYLRPLYVSTTTYAAGDEIYQPTEELFYVALRATTGNAPPNTAYWAECAAIYDAAEFDAALGYSAGDQVYYPPTETHYQCHTAAAAGVLPTDTDYFGELPAFAPVLPKVIENETTIGEVFRAWTSNPLVTVNAREIQFEVTSGGIRFGHAYPKMWLEYRARAPRLTGEVFSTTSVYAVNAQVYFETTDGTGDFYDCLEQTAAGETPDTNPEKWRIVELPEQFRAFLSTMAHSFWLLNDGQVEKAAAMKQEALEALSLAADRLFRQQGGGRRLTVETR